MNRRWPLVLVALLALLGGLAVALGVFEPQARPRPEGWNQEWAGLPLEQEPEWAVQPAKRSAVQAVFVEASERLAFCVEKYRPPEGEVVPIELMTETVAEGTHFEFVQVPVRADLPSGFSTCLSGALEGGALVPTPTVPAGTKWRLELGFLIPPVGDLPQVPWWRRFLPDGWRPAPPRTGHVG